MEKLLMSDIEKLKLITERKDFLKKLWMASLEKIGLNGNNSRSSRLRNESKELEKLYNISSEMIDYVEKKGIYELRD